MAKLVLFILAVSVFSPLISYAHPGRTDGSGCHTCKTNCSNWGLLYGEYHCHNSKGTSQPKEPIKSTYGENGTGYTTQAPEYKQLQNVTNNITQTTNTEKTEVKKISWFTKFINWFK